MAFPGYVFASRKDIAPLLEPADSGPTFQFCSELASRLGAHVFCGFAEAAATHCYNSQMAVSPEGKLLKSYHKHFLYVTDKVRLISVHIR